MNESVRQRQEDGSVVRVQKRMLLASLKDLYREFTA